MASFRQGLSEKTASDVPLLSQISCDTFRSRILERTNSVEQPLSSDTNLQGLESRKAGLIRRYLEIQDILDRYNDEVYQVTCEIEALNISIAKAKAEAAPSNNGTHPPAIPDLRQTAGNRIGGKT